MAERFDIVVAGAGHNSLIAAAYLAKAGYRCLVLEGRPIVGGGVKSAQLTLRGFTHDICSSAHNGIHGNPILRDDELKLGEYGLEYIYPDPVYHMPFPDGSYLTQWRDLDRTCEEFAKFSKKDGLAYQPNDYRIRDGQASLECSCVHADWLWETYQRPFGGTPARQNYGNGGWPCRPGKMVRDTFEDDHCRAFMLGCPYPLQPVQDPMDRPVRIPSAAPAAREPAIAERRVRSVDCGVGAVHRSAMGGRDSDQQVDQRADRGKREMRGAWNARMAARIARKRQSSRRSTSST